MQRFSTEEIVDAVVIGTGAGGAPLLSRLAKAGLKVVALEAGEHWVAAKDFSTDELDQSKLFGRTSAPLLMASGMYVTSMLALAPVVQPAWQKPRLVQAFRHPIPSW